MKQAYTAVLVLGVILGAVACGGKAGPATQSTSIRTILSRTTGEVQMERAGAAQAAVVGQELQAQDFIVTGSDSSADLAVTGYGVVKIGAGSRVQIQSLTKGAAGSDAQIRLDKGSVASFINRQDAKARYSVVTATAIAGVRGTAFLVSADTNTKDAVTKIAVLDGSVAVQAPGSPDEVIVEKNSQLVIEGQRRLTDKMVRPLSEESLKEIKRLAVFQKSNVLEFNTLLEEAQRSSPELRVLEGDASTETAMTERDERSAREGGLESVERAARADVSRTLKRDTRNDPIKLQPSSSFTN